VRVGRAPTNDYLPASRQLGRTSPPIVPHFVHTIFGPNDGTVRSPGWWSRGSVDDGGASFTRIATPDARSDKAYDVHEFVDDLRDLNVTPNIAENTTNRTSAIDARTTRHPGYVISQQKRKRTEEPFGWGKTIGGLARPMLRGVARLRFKFTLTMAAYDHPAAQIARGGGMTGGTMNRSRPIRRPSLVESVGSREISTNFSGLLAALHRRHRGQVVAVHSAYIDRPARSYIFQE